MLLGGGAAGLGPGLEAGGVVAGRVCPGTNHSLFGDCCAKLGSDVKTKANATNAPALLIRF
jgi:hypothetical protein